tara:strand:- start:6348 stop:6821 length:474 start_codon:yes stop_codon:yes gene_type:complete
MLGLSSSAINQRNTPFKLINTIDLTAFSSWSQSDVDTFSEVSGGLGWDVIDNDDDWMVYSDAFTIPSHAEQIVVTYDFNINSIESGGNIGVFLSSQTDGGGTNSVLTVYTDSGNTVGAYHMAAANTAFTRLVIRDIFSGDKDTTITGFTNCYIHILQ